MNEAEKKPVRPEDFQEGAVRQAVFVQTVQHPATIIPGAVALVSIFYIILIDHSWAPLGTALASSIVALGAWAYNFFLKGEELAKKHVENLKEQREREEEEKINREVSDLEYFFGTASQDKCPEANKELGELTASYKKLKRFLTEKIQDSKALNAHQFLSLANDTYKQGLKILRRLLEVRRALRNFDTKDLTKELGVWEKEIKNSKLDETQVRVLNSKIDSHKKRIRLYEDRCKTAEKLLAKCEEQEAALEIAYLELVELLEQDGDVIFSGQEVTSSALERAVATARKVEERLRQSSQQVTEEEEKLYLQK